MTATRVPAIVRLPGRDFASPTRGALPNTRAGLVGKALLWLVGFPVLVVIFALAALGRGLFQARAPAEPGQHPVSPPAIYQPHGPDQTLPPESPMSGHHRSIER